MSSESGKLIQLKILLVEFSTGRKRSQNIVDEMQGCLTDELYDDPILKT